MWLAFGVGLVCGAILGGVIVSSLLHYATTLKKQCVPNAMEDDESALCQKGLKNHSTRTMWGDD